MAEITITVPDELLRGLDARLRQAVSDALAAERRAASEGFLDVVKAASFLSSTSPAIRSLVKRGAIPYHKAPSGRLLFDPRELEAWVRGV
jgi:hypothetical protein